MKPGDPLPWDWPWGEGADMTSYGGRRSIEHLTVREVEEAKAYGLTSERYDELREKFEMRLRDKIKEAVKKEIYASAEKELRQKIRVEVEKDIRERVETSFEKEARAKLEAEIRAEFDRQVPNPKDINAYKEFAREIELDSLAQAHTASEMADALDQQLASAKAWRIPFLYLAFLLTPALWFGVHRIHEGLLSFVVAVVYALAVGVYSLNSGEAAGTERKKVDFLRKTSSDYRQIADRAKRVRMVDLPTAQLKQELRDIVSRLAGSKENQDRDFHPPTRLIDRARVVVRDQLVTEMDPEKLFESDEEASEQRRA